VLVCDKRTLELLLFSAIQVESEVAVQSDMDNMADKREEKRYECSNEHAYKGAYFAVIFGLAISLEFAIKERGFFVLLCFDLGRSKSSLDCWHSVTWLGRSTSLD
jgi:hypothetical protein